MKTSPASGEDRRFSPARPRLVPRAGAQDSLLCDPGLTDLTNPPRPPTRQLQLRLLLPWMRLPCGKTRPCLRVARASTDACEMR